jgi:hypothetical protein
MGDRLQVVVQRGRDADAVVAAQHHLVLDRFNFEHVPAVFGRYRFNHDLIGMTWDHPLNQTTRGIIRTGRKTGHC